MWQGRHGAWEVAFLISCSCWPTVHALSGAGAEREDGSRETSQEPLEAQSRVGTVEVGRGVGFWTNLLGSHSSG